jgi:uncharacterized protein (DUF697 family)
MVEQENKGWIDGMESWVQERLIDRVDHALAARRTHWQDAGRTRPGPADVAGLIQRAALQNAAVSGVATAVPGPAGFATMPVEVWLSLRLLVDLVYDIAVAHGRERDVDVAVLLGVIADDTSLAGRILVRRDGGTVVRRPNRRVLSRVVDVTAKHIARRLARLVLGRIVPVIGTAAAAWWARGVTRRVGRRADEVFGGQLDFEDVDPVVSDELEAAMGDEASVEPDEADVPDHVLAGHYTLLADAVKGQPTAAQEDVLTTLYDQASAQGIPVDPPRVVLERREPQTDLAVFAGRDPAVLFASIAAFGRLGEGVDAERAYRIGAAFGLDDEAVDELLRTAPPTDPTVLDA